VQPVGLGKLKEKKIIHFIKARTRSPPACSTVPPKLRSGCLQTILLNNLLYGIHVIITVFQNEPYNFESLYQFIQRICTVF
jgi:hypothetical protein